METGEQLIQIFGRAFEDGDFSKAHSDPQILLGVVRELRATSDLRAVGYLTWFLDKPLAS